VSALQTASVLIARHTLALEMPYIPAIARTLTAFFM
jgi:hypothetical protein